MGTIKGDFPVNVRNLKQLAKRMKKLGRQSPPETLAEWQEFTAKTFGYSCWHEAEKALGQDVLDELVVAAGKGDRGADFMLSRDYGKKTVWLTEEGLRNNVMILGKTGMGRLEVLHSLQAQFVRKGLPMMTVFGMGDNVDFMKEYSVLHAQGQDKSVRVLNFLQNPGQEARQSHSIVPLREWSAERVFSWLLRTFVPFGELVPDEAANLMQAIMLTKAMHGEPTFHDLAQSLEDMALAPSEGDERPVLAVMVEKLRRMALKVDGVLTSGGAFGEFEMDDVFRGYVKDGSPLRLVVLLPALEYSGEDMETLLRLVLGLIPENVTGFLDQGVLSLSGCGRSLSSDTLHLVEHMNSAGWGVLMEAEGASVVMKGADNRRKFVSAFGTKILMGQDDPETFELMPSVSSGRAFLPEMKVGEAMIVVDAESGKKTFGKLDCVYECPRFPERIDIPRV